MEDPQERYWTPRQRIGAVLAPLAFVGLWFAPLELSTEAHRLSAIFVAVIILWITEVLPIAATALLIAPLLVVCGVTDASTAFSPYADPLLFLFVGGFMIAQSMTRHGLDRRIALGIVSLKVIGDSPTRVRMAFMVTAALLSMWVSNTATAAILVPIMLGLLGATEKDRGATDRTITGSLLCIAYTCSIGGLGTPVGSPPNLIAMRFLKDAGHSFAFFDWVKVAFPITVVMIVVSFFVYAIFFPPIDIPKDTKASRPAPKGPLSKGEWVTLLAFSVAVVGWMLPGIFKLIGTDSLTKIGSLMPGGAVAILAASILFMFRDDRDRVLPWHEATQIDWGIIMLFGGGISLGHQLSETGLAGILATQVVEATGVSNLWALTALVTFFTIFFTEVCSNTATSNMVSPLVIAVAAELGVSPIPPVLAVGLAASCAFMLPIATGPNAVVYGSGRVTVPAMMQAGFALNLLCGLIIIVMLRLLCPLWGWG
ncbi:MAG: SLC13/DASS family transporter [Myxococcales bacterium]|nr:SLC13/DASS family transporter [Myxococcales bacterium]